MQQFKHKAQKMQEFWQGFALGPAFLRFTSIEEIHEQFTKVSRGLSTQYARKNYRLFSFSYQRPIICKNIPTIVFMVFAQFKWLGGGTCNWLSLCPLREPGLDSDDTLSKVIHIALALPGS